MEDRAGLITTTVGQCYFCQGKFSKAEMTAHLEQCPQRTKQAPLVVAIPTLSHKKWPLAHYFQLEVEAT